MTTMEPFTPLQIGEHLDELALVTTDAFDYIESTRPPKRDENEPLDEATAKWLKNGMAYRAMLSLLTQSEISIEDFISTLKEWQQVRSSGTPLQCPPPR